jgi:hypothetical protein
MSRPSITTDCAAPIRRCSSRIARRTPGANETFEAASLTRGSRIAAVTSSPFRRTVASPATNWTRASFASCSRRCRSSKSTPTRKAHSATARYIAPVSIYVNPRRWAIARAMVLLPAPAGPSIATIQRFCVSGAILLSMPCAPNISVRRGGFVICDRIRTCVRDTCASCS